MRALEGLMFASRLEVFFCLSTGRNTSLSYASVSAVTWFGSPSDCAENSLFSDIFVLTCDLEGNTKMLKRNHEITISRTVCHLNIVCHTSQSLRNFHQNLPQDIISVLLLEHPSLYVFHLSFPMFSPFSIPHLEWSPDVETGTRKDCLLGYKEWGGLWGA